METIVTVQGNVKYTITLDPTVWIFDDRKIDLNTYFNEERIEIDEDEKYLNSMGKHWSREIMEGAIFPPTLKTEKKFDRQKMVTGTFGILLKPFLKNAVLGEDAETITFITSTNQEETFPLSEAEDFIFKFSQDGKPLSEDGPVHLLFNDGSNIENPLKGICGIIIK